MTFITWQLNNSIHLQIMFNIINNKLKKNEIVIENINTFYKDFVLYIYNTTSNKK